MSKTEIKECIELNQAVIKESKAMINQLNKHLNFVEDYQNEFGGLEGVGTEFHRAIAFHMTRIEQANAFLAKRKKQLKLMEQLEAMENE